MLPWSNDFFLLYSTGGGYTDTGYSIWAARATNVTGPYTKATQVTPSNHHHNAQPIAPPDKHISKWSGEPDYTVHNAQPVVEVDRGRLDLGVNCTFEAPGHGSVVEDISGTPWLLYHAWPYQRKEVVSNSL